jgi:hypothetical protein
MGIFRNVDGAEVHVGIEGVVLAFAETGSEGVSASVISGDSVTDTSFTTNIKNIVEE